MRFLALGDSYTIGEGVSPNETWPFQLARRLRAEGIALADPVVVARTGWTTGELQAGIDRADPQGPFALVSLLIGVNDQDRGWKLEAYRVHFAALLSQAVAFAGDLPTRVIVLSIPDWGVTTFARRDGHDADQVAREIDVFNAANREETARQGAVYVNVTTISRQAATLPVWIADDGLHPTGAMYGAWVKILLPVVKDMLRGREGSYESHSFA